MKKSILLVLIPVLIITLVTLLYLNADTFEVKNVNRIQVGQFALLEADDDLTLFRDVLLKLEHYDEIEKAESIATEEILVDKRFGDSESYTVHLDGNYNNVVITDHANGKHYRIDDLIVEWLYTHEMFEGLYGYKDMPHISVTLDQQVVASEAYLSWLYELGDRLWYEDVSESGELVTIAKGPDGIQLALSTSLLPDEISQRVYWNDQVVYEGALNGFKPEHEGLYNYEIHYAYEGDHYSGNGYHKLSVYHEFPLEFTQSAFAIAQGDIVIITAKHVSDDTSLSISTDYMEGLTFYEIGDQAICVIPSTYYTQPGIYDLVVTGDGRSETMAFEVVDRTFEKQFLTVSAETTAATQTAEAYEEYNQYYKPALLTDAFDSGVNYFETPSFILPSYGRLTTEFGVNRYVNGKQTSYHHAGLDIANVVGTDVKATYDGKVVLSMYLQVTGNSIVISHGNGIFSTYFHLDELLVMEGQTVNQGDLIGKMGTTGFSTGSHLHFSISYYQMNLEPGQFIYGEKVTYKNYDTLFK